MALSNYGRATTSVFDLLGRGEVDLTAALGWTLDKSPRLTSALWERLGMPGDPVHVTFALEVADDEGRTDLELAGPEATVIIEAKKGWLVPGERQLAKYTGRFVSSPQGLLVSLSDSSETWASHLLPSSVEGVPVTHLPWDHIRTDIRSALKGSRGAERHWLTELAAYLSGATAVRDPSEQWVYCVVISDSRPGGGGAHTFRDFVGEHRYFHPYGGRNGWPKRPPILLAFRWRGVVRQVNRVVGHEVVPNLQARWPDVPMSDDTKRPHIVYDLGPNLPIPVIPTKGTYATARVWTLLDQLLTQPTLQDAVRASKALTQIAQ